MENIGIFVPIIAGLLLLLFIWKIVRGEGRVTHIGPPDISMRPPPPLRPPRPRLVTNRNSSPDIVEYLSGEMTERMISGANMLNAKDRHEPVLQRVIN